MILRSFRGSLSIPAVRALAASGLLWLSIFVYCNYALWRDPHGAYFHSEHIYDLGYTRVRQQEVRDFIHGHNVTATANATADAQPSLPQHAGDAPALCAAFVSVRREHPEAARYFSDSVGSMLEGLSPRERAALNLTVLFANADDPAQHPDFGAPWVSALVDHASGYEGVSEAKMAELRRLEKEQDFQRKGVIDYLYVLDQCYHGTRAPFIAVFEDDIVFAADWLARTLFALQNLATAIPADTTNKNSELPWLYLRLFYTETFREWDAEWDWWYGHLTLTLGFAAVNCAIGLVLARKLLLWRSRTRSGGGENHATTRKSWASRPVAVGLGLHLDVPTIFVLSFIVAPAFTALVFMAGKYNLPMNAPRGISRSVGNMFPGAPAWQRQAGVMPMERQGCCTQALVFDRARVPDLMAYLRMRERGQTDLMIEDYCRDRPLRRFALEEQAVQHVGVRSSRGMNAVNGQSVWAFFFEESRAEMIRSRHQRTLQGIDWEMFEALQGSKD